MDFLKAAIDFVLHIDRHLADIIARYGTWTYAILAGIVFCETGLVVTPLLPGDSLLFAAGSFAALGSLDPKVLNLLLFAAVLAGDNVNYWVGRFIGPRAFTGELRFFRKEYLDRTRAFFTRHGGKTVVLARFIPIVRTFTPFVAGVGAMAYPRFLAYSVAGGALWVSAFVWAGYFFGNLPVVRENFGLVVLGIIGLSVVPILLAWLRGRGLNRMTKRRYEVEGRVQDVGFRIFARRAAVRMGLVGWVRNIEGGRVEVLVHGGPAELEAFEAELRRGPPAAIVTNLRATDILDEQPKLRSFEIIE